MRRYLLIISAALVIVSLAIGIAASAIRTEVKQETALVSFEHNGTFDYLIHLKPSYLYGAPPLASPVYPAQIVNTIDFTFTYTPVETSQQIASIEAVLENPGLWQKRIPLMEQTDVTGTSVLSFSLDIANITKQFDDIEKEINITSSPRHLAITANVTGAKEPFIQSLPIDLTDTLIEVGSNLKESQSSGVGSFSYVVNLKNNSIFDSTTLVSPTTSGSPSPSLGPGQLIFARLVDSMDVVFNYTFKASGPVSNLSTDVDIAFSIQAPKLWSKTFPLLHTQEGGDFRLSFPLDMAGYTDLLGAISAETGGSADSYDIAVVAKIHTVGQTQFDTIDEMFTPTMKGTLKGNVLEWDKKLTTTQAGAIKQVRIVPNAATYLGLSVGVARTLPWVLAAIFFLFFAFSFWLYVRAKKGQPSRVDSTEVLNIQKKYRQRIAEATGQTAVEGEKVVSVASMASLVTIADELGKPLIHQSPGTPEERHAYYVFDGTTRYQYLPAVCTQQQASHTEKPNSS